MSGRAHAPLAQKGLGTSGAAARKGHLQTGCRWPSHHGHGFRGQVWGQGGCGPMIECRSTSTALPADCRSDADCICRGDRRRGSRSFRCRQPTPFSTNRRLPRMPPKALSRRAVTARDSHTGSHRGRCRAPFCSSTANAPDASGPRRSSERCVDLFGAPHPAARCRGTGHECHRGCDTEHTMPSPMDGTLKPLSR